MITNLLASIVITLVTNTTQADNHQGCPTCGWLEDCARKGYVPALNHFKGVDCWQPYIAPTWRTNTTTVTERRTLTFDWQSKQRVVADDKIISQNSKVEHKSEEWQDETKLSYAWKKSGESKLSGSGYSVTSVTNNDLYRWFTNDTSITVTITNKPQ